MQRYKVYLYLETSPHISGGTSTRHQERIPGQIPDAVDTVVCAPDDVWKYNPKHVEQFPNINKLCNSHYFTVHFHIVCLIKPTYALLL
jgi:hypothetical protein